MHRFSSCDPAAAWFNARRPGEDVTLSAGSVSRLGENCYPLLKMRNEVRSDAARAAKSREEGLAKRTLAAGDGWSVHDVVCRAGPYDRPFEERHDGFSISAVVEGS